MNKNIDLAKKLRKRGLPEKLSNVLVGITLIEANYEEYNKISLICDHDEAYRALEYYCTSVNITFESTLKILYGIQYLDFLKLFSDLNQEEAWMYDIQLEDSEALSLLNHSPTSFALSSSHFLFILRDVYEGLLDLENKPNETEAERQERINGMWRVAIQTLFFMPIYNKHRLTSNNIDSKIKFVVDNLEPWLELIVRFHLVDADYLDKYKDMEMTYIAAGTYSVVKYLIENMDDVDLSTELKKQMPNQNSVSNLITRAYWMTKGIIS